MDGGTNAIHSATSRASCDALAMRQALELAARGIGRTRPNPPVGAIVVRDGRVIGRGYHPKAGAAHAEVTALRQAGAAARGATLYVTLEPCSTKGRTGPCVETIARAGIARVVVGAVDPNPAHRGRGFRWLRAHGIDVTRGVALEPANALIAPFATWVSTGRPLVTLKLALTADGRIADRGGRSRWITGPAARREVQRLRATADAIIVGAKTARADDPELACRRRGAAQPMRVIVDSRGRLPLNRRVLREAADRTVIATTAACSMRRRSAYAHAGAAVWVLRAARGQVSIPALVERMGTEGWLHVLCEGGGELAAALIRAGAVDRYVFFVAPTLLGGDGRPALGGTGWSLAGAPRLRWTGCRPCGADVMLEGTPVRVKE